jgi:hypothetical protein
VLDALRVSSTRDNDLHVLREIFWEPKGDISFFSSFVIDEAIDSFDDNHNFLINFLRAIDYLLFFNLCTHDVQPIRKELSDVFFQQIHTLLELECFLEFDDNLIKRVEVVAVIAASAGEVHNCQDLFFSALIAQSDSFFPLAENRLHATAGFSPED